MEEWPSQFSCPPPGGVVGPAQSSPLTGGSRFPAAMSFHWCPKEAALVALLPLASCTHTHTHTHTHTPQSMALILFEILRGKRSRPFFASPIWAVIKDIIRSMESSDMYYRVMYFVNVIFPELDNCTTVI